MDQDKFETEQRLKAALHYSIGKICRDFENSAARDVEKSVMAAINELAYKQVSLYAQDLEAFAKHAKRSMVNVDDVKLLARKNPSLLNHIESLISHDAEKATTEGGKRSRKRAIDNRELE